MACLVTSDSTDQLRHHLGRAKDNSATEAELVEALTHLAFYTGWPRAMSAMAVAKLSRLCNSVTQPLRWP